MYFWARPSFIQLVEDEVLITISLQGRDVADSFDSLESLVALTNNPPPPF